MSGRTSIRPFAIIATPRADTHLGFATEPSTSRWPRTITLRSTPLSSRPGPVAPPSTTRPPRPLHGPKRDPDVVRHGALVVVEVRRQAVKRLDGHRAVFGQPARHREADVRVALVDLAVVLAEVVQALQAARAAPAADVDL